MEFLQALAVICLAGVLAILIWFAHSRFFRRSIGGEKTKVTIIVTTGGSPGELEQSVKGLLWLMSNNTLSPQTKIVIKTAGGSREIAEMAQILERENPAIIVIE